MEYQYVTFRALDAPLSKKALDYMHRQSSRAEIDEWSFNNEYHFANFRGDAVEMLRRGYDIHLHYANFGVRKLMIRLPSGLPDPKAAKSFFDGDSVVFRKDKSGRGAVLEINPFYETGELDDLWDIEEVFESLFGLRAELLEGDLRPLYLANLAVCLDDYHDPEETREAPVPAGLGSPTQAQTALAELYEIDKHLIAAAADLAPPIPAALDRRELQGQWLSRKSEAEKDAWLLRLMSNPDSVSELLADIRETQPRRTWPTIPSKRTISQIEEAGEQLRQAAKSKTQAKAAAAKKKADAKAARKREKQIEKMAADPKPFFEKTEQLVTLRGKESYEQIATLLADLREALAAGGQSNRADEQAWNLHKAHPRLTHLTAALRRKGFLPK